MEPLNDNDDFYEDFDDDRAKYDFGIRRYYEEQARRCAAGKGGPSEIVKEAHRIVRLAASAREASHDRTSRDRDKRRR